MAKHISASGVKRNACVVRICEVGSSPFYHVSYALEPSKVERLSDYSDRDVHKDFLTGYDMSKPLPKPPYPVAPTVLIAGRSQISSERRSRKHIDIHDSGIKSFHVGDIVFMKGHVVRSSGLTRKSCVVRISGVTPSRDYYSVSYALEKSKVSRLTEYSDRRVHVDYLTPYDWSKPLPEPPYPLAPAFSDRTVAESLKVVKVKEVKADKLHKLHSNSSDEASAGLVNKRPRREASTHALQEGPVVATTSRCHTNVMVCM